MAFCVSCGTQMADNAAFCPNCGKAASQASGTGTSTPQPTPAPPASYGNTNATAAPMAENVAGMLAYFTIIPAIIFLLIEPYNRNRFVRFHSFQCLFTAVALFVIRVCLTVVSLVVALPYFPVLGTVRLGLHSAVVVTGDQGVSARDVQATHRWRFGRETGQRIGIGCSDTAGPLSPVFSLSAVAWLAYPSGRFERAWLQPCRKTATKGERPLGPECPPAQPTLPWSRRKGPSPGLTCFASSKILFLPTFCCADAVFCQACLKTTYAT